MNPSFQIGVDGGGTKNEFILVDASGQVVASHLAPGGNPSQVGQEKARAILVEGLNALLAKSGVPDAASHVSRTLLCMAGSPPFWKECAASLTGFGVVEAVNDSIPVLELATGGLPGLVLHAGTGSFIAARGRDDATYYAGGLGWKLGDAGSSYDLGQRAIALAMLELQGWLPAGARAASPLVAELQAHTGLTEYAANSRFFYYDPGAATAISSFAPRVLALAENDCGPAQQVVADSVTDLARLADRVIHRLFSGVEAPVPCGVSGRILNSVAAGFALRSLAQKLRWPVTLQFLTTPPSEGVRRLLLRAR